MAAASLIGLYSLGLCTLYGLLAVWLTGKAAGKVFAPPSLTTVWLAGLCVVSALASILSLFMRLGLEANLILLAGAAAILAWLWKAGRLKWERLSLSLHPLAALAGLLCLLIVLEIATQRANNPDTGIYHAQAIRWIETYPVVPGLGNLHTRFAYNSSWLVANALFSFAFTGLRSFHLLPGVFRDGLGIRRRRRSLAPRTATGYHPSLRAAPLRRVPAQCARGHPQYSRYA